MFRRALLMGLVVVCGCFQGQYNSSSSNPASSTALKDSVTWKDTSHHYDAQALKPGVPRSQVLQAFGPPNQQSQQENGALVDAFAFYPDGAKFVNPTVRPRNLALAVLTLGTSVAARQARRIYVERKLTVYYVYYDAQQTVARVVRKEPAAEGTATPDQAAGQNAPKAGAPQN